MDRRWFGGQTHGREDLLDGGVGVDEGDEAQRGAAAQADDVNGKGAAQQRLYAGIHEWCTFASQLRFTPETTAALAVAFLLDLNVAAVGLALASPLSPSAAPAEPGFIMPASIVVCGVFMWLQAAVIKRAFAPAISELAFEAGSRRYWGAVAVLLYIASTLATFMWTLGRWM
jgi:hypothetical protein